MTTYSQSDLATRILRDAGLIGADEVPSAADLVFTQETLSSEIDQMGEVSIKIWNGSEIEVPSAYYTALSRRIVMAISPAFGLASAAEVELAMERVERTLRKLANVPGTGAPVQNEFI
jgi:hypothetical protein